MAVRRQSLSPTANLLRNSRLFALPKPLPKPLVGRTVGAGVIRASETATLPYPTHQAITTTKSSLARGDWGLKRPLPARSRLLRVSNPVLRVTQLDTIEHVTDFDSASDHVRTREKFQALGIPMMKGMAEMKEQDLSGTPPRGAFEVRDDTTSYDTDMGMDEAALFLRAVKQSAKKNAKSSTQYQPFSPPKVDHAVHNTRRWKHDGPWIPGMDAEEFSLFLDKEISKRRSEFQQYLREFVKNEIYTTRQLVASKQEEVAPLDPEEAEQWDQRRSTQWAQISEQDIQSGITSLRREAVNDPLGCKLFTKLILPFLRLPNIQFKNISYSAHTSTRDVEQYQFDQESALLSTHPSAGLGYLRTRSYIANHPILGPQSSPPPVPSRVVQARLTARSKEMHAKLGIAGFVAKDAFSSVIPMRPQVSTGRDVETIDIDTPGGKKILVQPMFASVSSDGRIHIKLKRSTGPEIQVANGELEDKPPARENVISDVELLKDFGQKSGNKPEASVLGEESGQARQMGEYLESMRAEDEAKGLPAA
ncbi:hypothetical protein ACEQ8H_006947 [Pleosporales sp. CAS-2024a]